MGLKYLRTFYWYKHYIDPDSIWISDRLYRSWKYDVNYVICRYCFLEFQSVREAEEAVATTNGYKLDKQHTFTVNPFSDFDK